MKEVLFKGISVITNKWMESMTIAFDKIYGIIMLVDDEWYWIKENTLCQYINKKDVNGVKIFEGDYDIDGNCMVWCDKCNAYEFAQIDVPTKDICISCHNCEGNFIFDEHIDEFKIIGNIND
jgi:hypothetical protein